MEIFLGSCVLSIWFGLNVCCLLKLRSKMDYDDPITDRAFGLSAASRFGIGVNVQDSNPLQARVKRNGYNIIGCAFGLIAIIVAHYWFDFLKYIIWVYYGLFFIWGFIVFLFGTIPQMVADIKYGESSLFLWVYLSNWLNSLGELTILLCSFVVLAG